MRIRRSPKPFSLSEQDPQQPRQLQERQQERDLRFRRKQLRKPTLGRVERVLVAADKRKQQVEWAINRAIATEIMASPLPCPVPLAGTGAPRSSCSSLPLRFASGQTVLADLAIGSDGANSRLRELVTSIRPGYVAVSLVKTLVPTAKQVIAELWNLLPAKAACRMSRRPAS